MRVVWVEMVNFVSESQSMWASHTVMLGGNNQPSVFHSSAGFPLFFVTYYFLLFRRIAL